MFALESFSPVRVLALASGQQSLPHRLNYVVRVTILISLAIIAKPCHPLMHAWQYLYVQGLLIRSLNMSRIQSGESLL